MGKVSDTVGYLEFRMNQITFPFSDWFPAEHLFDPGRTNDSNSSDDGCRNSNIAQSLTSVGSFLWAKPRYVLHTDAHQNLMRHILLRFPS